MPSGKVIAQNGEKILVHASNQNHKRVKDVIRILPKQRKPRRQNY